MTTIISHENNAHPGYPNHQAGNAPPGYPNYHGSNAPPGQQTYHGSNAPPGQQNYYGSNAPPGQQYNDSYTGSQIDWDEGASNSEIAVSLLAFIGWLTYTIGVGLIIERMRKAQAKFYDSNLFLFFYPLMYVVRGLAMQKVLLLLIK
jgi:hypothetical protein